MIDTHCHIDLYPNPEWILNECESRGIKTISMTNLPSHFEVGQIFFNNLKNVRLSLGLHPLRSQEFYREFPIFEKLINSTSYIGEVGLDYSFEGKPYKDIQLKYFLKIIELVSEKKKLLSIHSRSAEPEIIKILRENNIKKAVFHWYSGTIKVLESIVSDGYYFSVNFAMINSVNGKKIIDAIPRDLLLTESDGPYININNQIIKPWDVSRVLNYLSQKWNAPYEEVESVIQANFDRSIKNMAL